MAAKKVAVRHEARMHSNTLVYFDDGSSKVYRHGDKIPAIGEEITDAAATSTSGPLTVEASGSTVGDVASAPKAESASE